MKPEEINEAYKLLRERADIITKMTSAEMKYPVVLPFIMADWKARLEKLDTRLKNLGVRL